MPLKKTPEKEPATQDPEAGAEIQGTDRENSFFEMREILSEKERLSKRFEESKLLLRRRKKKGTRDPPRRRGNQTAQKCVHQSRRGDSLTGLVEGDTDGRP